MVSLKDILLTKEKVIPNQKGNIKHVIKTDSKGFCGFGEIYFSSIKINEIKGWKKHNKMTLNIVVPYGKIKFVIFDDKVINSEKKNEFFEVILSPDNYYRLTIPPGLFVAFQGIESKESILLNFSNIKHSEDIVDSFPLKAIQYDWKIFDRSEI